jgi:hypothetical protein
METGGLRREGELKPTDWAGEKPKGGGMTSERASENASSASEAGEDGMSGVCSEMVGRP